MSAWLWWVIAAAGLTVAELLTLNLVLIMVAVGALAAAATSAATSVVAIQAAVALGVSAAMIAAVRPAALRRMQVHQRLLSGTAGLVGQRALVLETVDAHSGRIKLDGEVWSARAFDESAVLQPGSFVDVLQIDGATAVVL